ncbi:MAG TPA: hypothetical protein H9796_11495 [Candidatus Butyricimonas faecavium]|nr:hypothetical protein [Candidatus Butyricimonas faecavium]
MRFNSKNETIEEAYDKMMTFIQDDRCREIFLVNDVLERYRGYIEFLTYKSRYKKYLKSEDMVVRVNQMEKTLKKKDSEITPNFTYPDMDGKLVSLSDFKGKIVIKGFWNCFLRVSLDKVSDREKWLQMIKEKSLKGIQVFANGWS